MVCLGVLTITAPRAILNTILVVSLHEYNTREKFGPFFVQCGYDGVVASAKGGGWRRG